MSPIALGARTLLRAPTAGDRDEFLALTRASRKFHRRWGAPPTTPDRYAAWLRRYRTTPQIALLACRRADGRIIGAFTLMEIVRGQFQSAYLGYWAGRPFAGRGYMTEALGLVLRHAFTRLRLHRVEANIQPSNRRSIELVRRWGFRCEGFSPRYLKIGGRWRDHERWAIIREDWRASAAPRTRSRRPGPRSRASIRSRRRRVASTARRASPPSASRRSAPRS